MIDAQSSTACRSRLLRRVVLTLVTNTAREFTSHPTARLPATNASTSVVLSGARLVDEPTDIDPWGNPLYMKATVPLTNEMKQDSYEYVAGDKHRLPDPKPPVQSDIGKFIGPLPQGATRDRPDAYDLHQNSADPNYRYAKDLLMITKSGVDRGEQNRIYVDKEYEPHRIAEFYDKVFRHNKDHFMVGTAYKEGNQKYKFTYNSMHEALKVLLEDEGFFEDYEKCIRYVWRDVCSADAFYMGILGLSIKDNSGRFVTSDGKSLPSGTTGVPRANGYEDHEIEDEYYGVSSTAFDSDPSIEPLKTGSGGLMAGPGEFSSILEHFPVTAFIKERKDAVKAYVNKVNEKAQGVQFANADR